MLLLQQLGDCLAYLNGTWLAPYMYCCSFVHHMFDLGLVYPVYYTVIHSDGVTPTLITLQLGVG